MLTIAGATGRVGGAVASALLAAGTAVRVVVRTVEAAAAWRRRGAEAVVAELEDAAALTRGLDGCSGFFALVPEDPAAPDFRARRLAIADAIAASVAAARVPHVVLLSSAGAPTLGGPAAELRHAEAAVLATGATVTIVRAAFFQDNLAAGVAFARERGMFASLLDSPDRRLAMVATTDVAALCTACLRRPPARTEVVDLTGPSYSMTEAADELGRAIGRRLEVMTIPAAGRAEALQQTGLQPDHAAALAELFDGLSAGPLALRGDRLVTGTRSLGETLAAYAAAGSPAAPEHAASDRTTSDHTTTDRSTSDRTTTDRTMTNRTTIDGVVASLTDAWNRHDLAAMGALYVADADFVNIFGGHLRGRDEIVREHTERHKQMFAAARMSNGVPDVRRLTPSIALARVAWTMRGIAGPGGAPAADRAGVMLHVLELVDGGWWILATHNTEVSRTSPPRFLDLPAAS